MRRTLLDPIGIYAILDTALVPAEAIPSIASKMACVGVRVFQVRAKNLSARSFFNIVKFTREALPQDCLVIANDRADVALCAEGDGVHVGQDDISVDAARSVVGADKIVGVTTHTLDEVRVASTERCDYIAFGPIFATRTKVVPVNPHGIEGLEKALKIAKRPIVAIGGIEIENIRTLRQLGVSGVAMIRALLCADDILEAAKRAVRAFFE